MGVTKILVINGPNLNMLGSREPELYGTTTLSEIEEMLRTRASELGVLAVCVQSNHEGRIIDVIQRAHRKYQGILINAGGYSHTSVAIHDALRAAGLPAIAIHITEPKKREWFRQKDVVSEACLETISGKGINGYLEGLNNLAKRLGVTRLGAA